MGKADVGMIREFGEQVNHVAGESVARKVMEGSDEITEKTSKEKIALWVREAMERLDEFLDEKTKIRIMENCGYNCVEVNNRVVERAKARRRKYGGLDKFLEAEQKRPMKGTKLTRSGNKLIQTYTPQSFTRPMRCYCSLLRALPENDTVSLTYCHCSKGFVKKYWEKILEKPVEVELVQSAVSGAKECKFIITF